MIETAIIPVLADGALTAITDEFGIYPAALIAQAINFLLVLVVLYFFAFKPILATMDKRQKKISEGLEFAEEMKIKLAESEKKQAEVLKNASLEAQKIVQQAKEDAKTAYEKHTREAAERGEELLAKAKETIERERGQMLTEVRQEVARLVVLATAKILRKELSEDEKVKYTESAARDIRSH